MRSESQVGGAFVRVVRVFAKLVRNAVAINGYTASPTIKAACT